MDETLEMLYQHLVGMPNPNLWPIETKNSPMLGHGFYSFIQGLRLGFSLGHVILSASEESFPVVGALGKDSSSFHSSE